MRVDVVSQTEQEVNLQVTVSDTGIGIPADKHAKIFKAFEQADQSTTRKHGGTGLGLAIVTKLVAMMGGKIWVESEVEVGSTFHFTAQFQIRAPRAVPELASPDRRMLPVNRDRDRS